MTHRLHAPAAALPEIYLASQSPRRQELLQQIGVRFELLLPADAAEAHALEALEERHGNEAPGAYVRRVTALKLRAAQVRREARGLAPRPILCADTTVARGNCIYGKPLDDRHAADMLRELAGSTHRVLTAIAVGDDSRIEQAVSESRVEFAPMTAAQIDAYVQSREPVGKAGAYAIQGRAAAFVRRIHGSHSGIMGLPLYETAQLLGAFMMRP